jgi:hypothetical protein
MDVLQWKSAILKNNDSGERQINSFSFHPLQVNSDTANDPLG